MRFTPNMRKVTSRLVLHGCFLSILLCDGGSAFGQISGKWTDGDPQRTLRDVHLLGAATRLKDGRVVAAGGLDLKTPPFGATSVAELYDPVKQKWCLTGSLNTPRWSLDAITLPNGKALFAGGASAFAADAALSTAEIFDPELEMFTFTANQLSVARQSFGISMLNDGRVLISGGNSSGNNLNGTGVTAVDLYDPASNRFKSAASMNLGRSLHAQLSLRDGRVVVIGGAQKNAEIYEPEHDRWTVSSGNLPTTLKDIKAFELFDGRIFIPGGQNSSDGVTSDATWFFDTTTGQFSPGPVLTGFNYSPTGVQVGCSDYSAFDLFPADDKLHGRYILIAGGEHDPLTGPDVELHSAVIFDATRNKLIDVGPMPFIHDDHTESMLQVNDAGHPELLLLGGNQSQGTSRFVFDSSSVNQPSSD